MKLVYGDPETEGYIYAKMYGGRLFRRDVGDCWVTSRDDECYYAVEKKTGRLFIKYRYPGARDDVWVPVLFQLHLFSEPTIVPLF